MSKPNLNYMAGIFDGEGSICILKGNRKGRRSPLYTLTVSVGMANPYIPNLFKFAFGGKIYIRKPQKETHLPKWEWRVSCQQAMEFLRVISPFLHLKGDEAKVAIAFQEVKQRPKAMKGKGLGRFGVKSDEELAVEEAQKILLHNMHNKSGVNYGQV